MGGANGAMSNVRAIRDSMARSPEPPTMHGLDILDILDVLNV